ncbi:bis-aminopropyl spermidine synthase family protein [Candidatus Lokiarchaeum ossiferum]|uniref:bis-aminopropyl spermidine synthase family protein n=1 Tax=Candidatus Lokiarchaeum ossiferum TaxID=2951803 RepID=UPI00352E5091
MANFLEELQSKITIKEGIEGHRSILREIYRAGHISLQDLAFKTLLPISLLSKIVNFLIEKELLGRIPEGILYTEKGMQFVEAELHFYGIGISNCEECGDTPVYISPRWDGLLDKMDLILGSRPKVDTTLDQAFADAETDVLRALYLYQKGALEGKSLCFLGDDDFTSLSVVNLYEGIIPEDQKMIPTEIMVVDIDQRMLSGIQANIPNNSMKIEFKLWDYRHPVPNGLIHRFDTIMVDPPYSLSGLRLVLSRAISLLRTIPGGEIYLSFAHRAAEDTLAMHALFCKLGLAVIEMIPRFNYYEGAGILGNTTQMIRLVTTTKSSPLISPKEEFQEKIYTGEIKPNIRYYFCNNCGKLIPIGETEQLKTVEQLKAQKCPHCNADGPFNLDHKEDA